MPGTAHSGRKPLVVAGRAWFRSLVDDKARRQKFRENLDASLERGEVDAFMKCFEHGYGRPPQALDVKTTVDIPAGVLPVTIIPADSIAIGGTDE